MPDKGEMLEGLVKGLLGGVGNQIYSATDRERRMTDEGRRAEIDYWTSQLPRLRADPQAQQDILGRIFDLHGAHAKTGGKMTTDLHKNLMPAKDFIQNLYGKVYPSGMGSAEGQPETITGMPNLVGAPLTVAGKPEVPDRPGPFYTPDEIQAKQLKMKQAESDILENRLTDTAVARAKALKATDVAGDEAEYQARKKRFEELQQPTYDESGNQTHAGYPVDVAADIAGFKGVRPPVDHPETRVIITTKDGQQIEGWQDSYSHKFTDLNQQSIDPTTIKEVNPKKETNADQDRDLAFKAFREKHGMPEGAPLSSMQQVEAIKNFKIATNVGAQTIINNPGGQAISDDQLRTEAELALLTGKDPSFGMSARDPTRLRYQAIKADLIKGKGGAGEVAAAQGEFGATKGSLNDLTKLRGQMKSAESGTLAEINRLIVLSRKLPRSSIRAFNTLDQFLTAQLTPGTDLARFREALLAARYRYNSMISSLRSGGTATNAVRAETADEIINRSMSNQTLEAAADEMKVGVANVMKGLDSTVEEVRGNLSNVGKPKSGGSGDQNPNPQTVTPGQLKAGARVRLKNGKVVTVTKLGQNGSFEYAEDSAGKK